MHKYTMRAACRLTALALALPAALGGSAAAAADVAPSLLARAQGVGRADALIVLEAEAPKALLRQDGNYLERRRNLVDTLRATAEVSQEPLRRWLEEQGVKYRSFWIVNMIQAELTPAQIAALAGRAEVARLVDNAPSGLRLPPQPAPAGPQAPEAIEWGVNKVRAPQVWALGVNGQGVTIAGQDTGIRWTHNALKSHYRGWNGSGIVDHNYNWHDAIHAANGSCPADSPQPCDDNGHGSHTVGTMVGDDGGSNQVGVAPGAQWIGCRNMNAGNGTPASYNECAQWLLAPTDLAGNNPDPARAPDIVSNSWGCPASEGCTAGNEVKAAVDALVQAGILFVAAAGNDGSSCSTIFDEPATLDSAFTIGSTTSSDAMSSFSSRGPVTGAGRVKPDVSAPGSSVRSVVNSSDTSYTTMSGTSMATPHVAGAAALVMAVNPALKGDPQRVMDILRQTAVPISNSQTCGGIAPTTYPNPVQGYGRIDAYAAVILADTIFKNGVD